MYPFSFCFSGGRPWQRYSSKASSFSSSPSLAYASNSLRLFPKGTCMCVCAARGVRESGAHAGCTCMYTFAALVALHHSLSFCPPLSLDCLRARLMSVNWFCTHKLRNFCAETPSILHLLDCTMYALNTSGHVWFFLAFTRFSPLEPLSSYVPLCMRYSYMHVHTNICIHCVLVCVLQYVRNMTDEELDLMFLNVSIKLYTCNHPHKCIHLCVSICVSLYMNVRWYVSATIFSYIQVNIHKFENIYAFLCVHSYM